MESIQHDLVVIGGGPGGYVAAIRAGQLGLDVACIDANPLLGGTCLRVGCIPSKALLESSERFAAAKHSLRDHGVIVEDVKLDLQQMMRRKDDILQTLGQGTEGLLKKNKVALYRGHAQIDGSGQVHINGGDGQRLIATQRIIIATGSKPQPLPGVELDGDRIGTSTEALAYTEVPKHLVVIGAGYIGLEMGSVWLRMGAKVTVLEALDRILPGTDAEIAREALKIFKKQGFDFRLSSRVQRAYTKKSHCVVECEGQDPIKCDRVLLAIGRVANTDNLGLDSVGIECDRQGRIPVDDGFATAAEGIYAVGDCIAGPMLAHKASEEGIACVERIAGGYGRVHYDAIPSVVYTHPEIASVGKTEDQLKSEDAAYRKGIFHFRANSRARTLGELEGRVKILADPQTDRVLGVHILGPRAGDLIAEAVAGIEFGATAEDIARCCHAHPSLSEALGEAARAVGGGAIHG